MESLLPSTEQMQESRIMGLEDQENSFGLLVTLVVLYGCEVWGSSMSDYMWSQLERIQKHLISNNFKVKSMVPYEILLVEAGLFLMEVEEVFRFLSYLKKVEVMDEHRWPKIVVTMELTRRKKNWGKQNDKWLGKWGIKWQDFPNSKEEVKKWVHKKFRTTMWEKQFEKNLFMSKIST